MVKSYFDKIYKLAEGKLLPHKNIIRLLNQGQVDFALSHVEPLEKAINKQYDYRPFKFLAEIYGKLAHFRFASEDCLSRRGRIPR
jgi:hypothetical protein